MLRVPSSDGVVVAVHEFGGAPDAPPLLLSHATGFHAYCYEPVASRLTSRFRVYALDYRGHGETPAPEGWQVDWQRFGDDAVAVQLWRVLHGEPRTLVTTVEPDVTTARDELPAGVTRARYAVVARDDDGVIVARSRAVPVA